jgi:hypothetical protein
MVGYIEEHAKGQVLLEIINFDGNKMEIRKHLYKQFGAGTGGDIHAQELHYEKGMPEPGQLAFPKGVDIGEKLRQLEGRRLYFLKMCEPGKRGTYTFCQETKLVRIVLEHVGPDYKYCVQRVLDLVKITKMIQGGGVGYDVAEVPDTHDRSFSDDWLPSWKLLQASLISEYRMKLKGKEELAAKKVNKDKIPIAMGGFKDPQCFACGGAHKKGDPSCKAGPYDVHSCAPAEFKLKQEEKKRKFGGKGKGKGKGNKGGDGNRKPQKKGKVAEVKHCHAFNFGKGTCRYGAKCHFVHEVKKGGAEKDSGFTAAQEKLVSSMMASAIKRTATHIAKQGKQQNKKQRQHKGGDESECDDSDDEGYPNYAGLMARCWMSPVLNTIPRTLQISKPIVLASSLHNVKRNCGIDTDAGLSISTLREDFPLWLDTSQKALTAMGAPSGINGGESKLGGTGPMIIRAKSGEFLIDPDGLYIEPNELQPNFRVLSSQRLKMHGVRLVQCFRNTDKDVLQDRKTRLTIELAEDGPEGKKILVLDTVPCPALNNRAKMHRLVDQIKKRNVSAMVPSSDDENRMLESRIKENAANLALIASRNKKDNVSMLIFNEAKCNDEERSRLYVRRLGFCSSNLFPKMMKDPDIGYLPKLIPLNEDNPISDAAKFKKKSHVRTPTEISMTKKCWAKVYVDGYGGGSSMGCESYEGAIGGYLFVCSTTGDMHHKLYASHEQFPAAMFQFLTHVESEGHRCHEIYCDTFSVNISKEIEEVIGLFQVKLVPVSAGTPQEVSFVETAVRVIAARSRAMMLGAPHLPKWCWALADKHAVFVGRLLPQSTRQWKSAYFLNRKIAPDWRNLSVHVFGAPCQYAPVEGPIHKRAERTEEGFYVGVQHPMVLVLRKHDLKLISCSRKKIIVYESIYTLPLSVSSSQLEKHIRQESEQTESSKSESRLVNEEVNETTMEQERPYHVQSIKSVSSHSIPPPNTTAPPSLRAPTALDASAETQSPNSGEGLVVPEHAEYTSDLQNGISKMKERAEKEISNPGIRQRVIQSLKEARESFDKVAKKGSLKKGKKSDKSNVSTDNVVNEKRSTGTPRVRFKDYKDLENNIVKGIRKKVKDRKIKLITFSVGDTVTADSKLFDGDKPGSYSKDHPELQVGEVIKVWNNKGIAQIKWLDGSKSYQKLADLMMQKLKNVAAYIVGIMMVSGPKKAEDPNDKNLWPKDFFQAMIRPDWREWISAVKTEIASWLVFNAYTEIAFRDKKPGASIVPLGELYTRKRNSSYKFRQYLMGNLLRQGKDFDETFSSCISWDGIRWACSIACTTGKLIRGLDAVTGFLQAKEQFDLYAFIPSHGHYSNLSYEDLAVLRLKLLDLVEKEGEAGLKKFASAHKKESRVNPKTCYKLNSSIYGAPSANHEWEMLFQAAHVKHCGMTLSEVEPSLYLKIEVDENDNVTEWMIATIWTDDVRYFGTDKMLDEYEKELGKHIKVKLLGVPGEFVGVDVIQNLDLGTLELKAPKYWETALGKLGAFFPNGVKKRHNPLSIYDERFMLDEAVSDDEAADAATLPYREVCGIVSYPASCTKLEMRYAVSICGKHRTKWGKKQFKVLLKVFEYGYTTRHLGIIYSKGLDKHGDNVLYCYADSGHSLPRSYGSTLPMMNGGALGLSAKRHTLTASSTMQDESIEYSIATNRVVGFRNLSSEMGFPQHRATKIYQDNEACIQVMKNRGSLSKLSRHIGRRILAARNMIEDGETIPEYCFTKGMLADIGTKAFADKQFCYLRDQLNGYALVKAHHPSYSMPSYVVEGI